GLRSRPPLLLGVGQLQAELRRLRPQLGVAELLDARLEVVDGVDARRDLLDLALVLGAEDFLQEPGDHRVTFRRAPTGRPGGPAVRLAAPQFGARAANTCCEPGKNARVLPCRSPATGATAVFSLRCIPNPRGAPSM